MVLGGWKEMEAVTCILTLVKLFTLSEVTFLEVREIEVPRCVSKAG